MWKGPGEVGAGLYDFEVMSHEEPLGTAEGLKSWAEFLKQQVRNEKRETEKVREALTTALAAAVLSAGGVSELTVVPAATHREVAGIVGDDAHTRRLNRLGTTWNGSGSG